MNEQFVEDVYTRFVVHEHLLMQLYLQMAHGTDDPQATLNALEARMTEVMASLRPPAHGMEDWGIRLLQAQRKNGPGLIQNFFRKIRSNLPES